MPLECRPLAGSGCLGEAEEGGPATDHVCAGATTRPRMGPRVRVTVLLVAQGPVGVAARPLPPAPRSGPTRRLLLKAGPKTQEAPLAVADSRTLEGDSCSDINAGPARAWPFATRSCAGASTKGLPVGCGSIGAPRRLEAAEARHAGRTLAPPWSRPTSTRRSRGPR